MRQFPAELKLLSAGFEPSAGGIKSSPVRKTAELKARSGAIKRAQHQDREARSNRVASTRADSRCSYNKAKALTSDTPHFGGIRAANAVTFGRSTWRHENARRRYIRAVSLAACRRPTPSHPGGRPGGMRAAGAVAFEQSAWRQDGGQRRHIRAVSLAA